MASDEIPVYCYCYDCQLVLGQPDFTRAAVEKEYEQHKDHRTSRNGVWESMPDSVGKSSFAGGTVMFRNNWEKLKEIAKELLEDRVLNGTREP